MKLAIHVQPDPYVERWVARCRSQGINWTSVDCLDPDINRVLSGHDGLLWRPNSAAPHELIVARHVIAAAEARGLAVFPSTATIASYDDKVAQKYLLEAVAVPLVPTWVFCDAATALRWMDTAMFPLVFKLRRGAGSRNVRLVRSARAARGLVRRAFRRGFVATPQPFANIADRVRRARNRQGIRAALGRFPSTFRRMLYLRRTVERERGYVYFQEFVPGNAHDTRVTIIGERAFAFRRGVRPGDFRASGSGRIIYDRDAIDRQCLRTAFEVARRVESQSLAFDFVHRPDGTPLITEISYTFDAAAVKGCGGFWTPDLAWRDWDGWPQDAILDDLCACIRRRSGHEAHS